MALLGCAGPMGMGAIDYAVNGPKRPELVVVVDLPKIPGGKKMIYPHIQMELTAISDFEKLGKDNALFAELDKICKKKHGIWCEEAERYLLSYYHVL